MSFTNPTPNPIADGLPALGAVTAVGCMVPVAVVDAPVMSGGNAPAASTGSGLAVPPLPIPTAAAPAVAGPVLDVVLSVEPHLPAPTMPSPMGMPADSAATAPVSTVAFATADTENGAVQPASTYAMAATQANKALVPAADKMQVDLSPEDDDGFTVVRSKKRSRLDAEAQGGGAEGRVAPHPGRLPGGALTGPAGARALGGRRDMGGFSAGARARSPRRDGVVPHPGFLAQLRMSPLEEGQLAETRSPATLGFSTLDGVSFAPSAASPTTVAVAPAPRTGGDMTAPAPAPPPAPRPRNATPGPSVPARPAGPDDRAALRALVPMIGQENIPPLPAFTHDLSPLLRMQTLDFLSRLPVRLRDAVVNAANSGVVPRPLLVSDFPHGFWPEAAQWAESTPWLWAQEPPAAGGEPVHDRDHPMHGGVGAQELAPLPGLAHLVQLPPPAADPAAPQVVDIQNLAILPNCVPNGGRQTNRDFPFERTFVHGAAQIMPPFEITQTPEPLEGFPRIRHGDPEAPYAGWEVERIRQISLLDPETTVIASVHAPVAIQAGGGWSLVQAVKNFVASICGATNVFVVPVEVPNPVPRYDPDDVHTWVPTSFPLWNLPPGVATGFVEQQSFSTPTLTIHFFPTTLRLDDLLGRIEGFTSDDVEAVTLFIKSRLESDDVQAILRKYLARNPRRNTKPLDDAARDIVDSLSVQIEKLPSTDQPIALVFLDSPADSIDADRAYRKDMKTVHWKSLTYGTGVLIYLPPCRGCGSVAHRTENCPFPDLPGWLGPTHAEVARSSVRPGGRARGAAVVGRGRGRPMNRG